MNRNAFAASCPSALRVLLRLLSCSPTVKSRVRLQLLIHRLGTRARCLHTKVALGYPPRFFLFFYSWSVFPADEGNFSRVLIAERVNHESIIGYNTGDIRPCCTEALFCSGLDGLLSIDIANPCVKFFAYNFLGNLPCWGVLLSLQRGLVGAYLDAGWCEKGRGREREYEDEWVNENFWATNWVWITEYVYACVWGRERETDRRTERQRERQRGKKQIEGELVCVFVCICVLVCAHSSFCPRLHVCTYVCVCSRIRLCNQISERYKESTRVGKCVNNCPVGGRRLRGSRGLGYDCVKIHGLSGVFLFLFLLSYEEVLL